MKRAIGYCRVSTDKQAEKGVSLDNQKEKLRAYCEFNGWDLVGIIEDAGVSGGINRGRDGFNEVLDIIETGAVQAVVTYSLERLSRDMLTLLALEKFLDEYDCELHTPDGQVNTSSPDGFMGFVMKAVFGEYERRIVKHRTKKSMEHMKKSGRLVGAVPFGFEAVSDMVDGREVKRLVPNLQEQRTIREVNEMHGAGLGLSEIVSALGAKGCAARNGKLFEATQIKRMITGYEKRWRKNRGTTGQTIRQFISAIG